MPGVRVAWYTGTLFAGYLLMLTAGIWIWRLLRHDLLDDVFNDENESCRRCSVIGDKIFAAG